VSETFATEDLGELTLHGFARAMHAFRLVGRSS
jgi:class 3 adenylate cyclase